MKKILLLSLSLLTIFASCTKYDDSALTDRLDDLESEVEDIKAQIEDINSQLSTLQQLIDGSKFISEVTDNGDGTSTITFITSSGETSQITIGSSETVGEIGIAQDTDGEYYWTLDGEFILVDGEKIPTTGEDSVTPKFKYENYTWMVSYDNGVTWEECSDDAAAPVIIGAEVTADGNFAEITLADGTSLTFEIYKSFSITFTPSSDVVVPGGTIGVPYSIVGGDDNSIIEVIAGGNWTAEVAKTDNLNGVIRVTAPEDDSNGKVIVLVSDGDQKTIMRTLNFVSGSLSITTSSFEAPAEGGALEFDVETNLDFTVSIPESVEWISFPEESRATEMRTETVTLNITANNESDERSATITLHDAASGKELESIFISQPSVAKVFEVEAADEVTANSFVVSVTPNNFEGNYFVGIISKDELQQNYYNDLATMINMEIYNLEADFGITVANPDGKYTFTGAQSSIDLALCEAWDILPSTEYVVYVCGVDPTQLYYETTEIITLEATTTDEEPVVQGKIYDLEVIANDMGGITVNVDPKEQAGMYLVAACPTKKFKTTYAGDANKMASMEAFDYVTTTSADNVHTFTGVQSNLDITDTYNVLSLTDYVVYVCGVDAMSFEIVTTEVVYEYITTKEAPAEEFTIDLAVRDITSSSALLDFTVLENDFHHYFVGVCTADDYTNVYKSDIESAFTSATYDLMGEYDQFYADDINIFIGSQTGIELSDNWTLNPSTDYIVYVGAIDPWGLPDGEIEMTTFTTDGEVVVPDEVFTLAVTDPSAASLTASVAANDFDGAYFVGICSKSDFETKYYSEVRRMALAIASEISFNNWIDLDKADNKYTFEGDQSSIALASTWSPAADTDYILFACGTDAYGTETKTDIITLEFTTK